MSFQFTVEQVARLRDLEAGSEDLRLTFEDADLRDKTFLRLQKRLTGQARLKLERVFQTGGQPLVESLSQKIATKLCSLGMVQVSTPIIMSRARLARMLSDDDPLLTDQVFWLDEKRCLRPMLAPHLYEFMLDLSRLRAGSPFAVFEIGPCFRKESQGSKHAGEFTMLNLVEVGLKPEDREGRLLELAGIIFTEVGLSGWRLETVDSTVYGQTVDLVDRSGLELASCSMGPHELDAKWGFSGTWLGLGFGLERLAMSLGGFDRLSVVGRGFGRLLGIPLNI
ncbi:MAG: pyrrolysine--tRNA(Pyl) ligase large subunit [Deltaproteobacteria bacterium]|nr:pyrrolysine--tRNA(Pyl) ligase large subunit [Deltaproteobacteria bacterium]